MHIAAKLIKQVDGATDADSTDSTELQQDEHICKTNDTAKLAQFLADLTPDGFGSFDTSCFVSNDWQPVPSQQCGHPASAQELHHKLQTRSAVQALLQKAASGKAKQLANQWLAPIVALFSSPKPNAYQHLCLTQRTQHTLGDALRFTPAALQDDALCRLILFQVLSCLQGLHSQGLHLGQLTPDAIFLSPDRSASSWYKGLCAAMAQV